MFIRIILKLNPILIRKPFFIMQHLKLKFTDFLKVFTQYALILRRSVLSLLVVVTCQYVSLLHIGHCRLGF
jgi:hypothetical protein